MKFLRKALLRWMKIDETPRQKNAFLSASMSLRLDDDIANAILTFNSDLLELNHRKAAPRLLHLVLQIGISSAINDTHLKRLSSLQHAFGSYTLSYLVESWWQFLHHRKLVMLTDKQKKQLRGMGPQASVCWLSTQNFYLAKGIIRLYILLNKEQSIPNALSLIAISNRSIAPLGTAAPAIAQEVVQCLDKQCLIEASIPLLNNFPDCFKGASGRFFKSFLAKQPIRA